MQNSHNLFHRILHIFLFVLFSFITLRFQLHLQLQWNCQSHLQSIWNQIQGVFSMSELFSGRKWNHLKSKLTVDSLLQVFMRKCQVAPVSLQMLQVLLFGNGTDSKLWDKGFSWTVTPSVPPIHCRLRVISGLKYSSLCSVHLWNHGVGVVCVLMFSFGFRDLKALKYLYVFCNFYYLHRS